MVAFVFAIVVVLTGCTTKNINRGWFVASHVTLACDYGQTVVVANRGWTEKSVTEGNPILGSSPSVARLTAYDLGVASLNSAIYLSIPNTERWEKWKWFIPLVITIVELQVITMNTVVAPKPWCGIR